LHQLRNAPIPPSVNKAYRNVPGQGRVASRELCLYKRAFQSWALLNAKALSRIKEEISETQLTLSLTFRLPFATIFTLSGTPKMWDVSNRIKVIEDCLCKVLGLDDKWVWSVTARKEESQEAGVDIEIGVA
jgi:Holliday junction resolvase RusA-like endonuclease